MKRVIAMVLCVAATSAFADDDAIIDELEVRLSEMENIEVTSEKTPVESAESVDEEVDKLLDELETLESEGDSD